jgi:ATP-dependent Clp protease ATP-binding subunit ClpC
MFEKFTEGLRKVMSLARQEAQHLDSAFIGTEHLLIGILREDGIVAKILKERKVDLDGVRLETKRLVKQTPSTMLGQIPFAPRAKSVIVLAGETSSKLGQSIIGTDHLLLGLLQEREGIAFQILQNLGVDTSEIERTILEDAGAPDEAPKTHSTE